MDEIDTRLWHGVKKNEIAEVSVALAQGAVVDVRDRFLRTPLMVAVKCGNQEIISLLLTHGADVNAHDNTGDTPLIYALLPDYTEIVNLLINHGANVTLADKSGDTTAKLLSKKQLTLTSMTFISVLVFVQGQRRLTKDKDIQRAEIIAMVARLFDVYVTYQKYEQMKKLPQGQEKA